MAIAWKPIACLSLLAASAFPACDAAVAMLIERVLGSGKESELINHG